jgi:hypothetical protein
MNRDFHLRNAAFGMSIGVALLLVLGLMARVLVPVLGPFGIVFIVVPFAALFLTCFIVSSRAERILRATLDEGAPTIGNKETT